MNKIISIIFIFTLAACSGSGSNNADNGGNTTPCTSRIDGVTEFKLSHAGSGNGLSVAGKCDNASAALLTDNYSVEFPDAVFVAGLYVSNAEKPVLPANSQSGVYIQGERADGTLTPTIHKVTMYSNFRDTFASDKWEWVDLTELGQVKKLYLKADYPTVIDKLYIAKSSKFDSSYETILIVPDTQKYTETYHDILDSQFEYIANNTVKENIVFVSHVGDITENGALGDNKNKDEWDRAVAAINKIDNVVPYGITVGNHDYDDFWNNPQLGANNFKAYFPESRYSGKTWWCGYSPDNLSSCQKFTMMGKEFIYLHISVDTPQESIDWAQGIVDANPNTPVAVTTHVYLNENGRFMKGFFSNHSTWDGLSAEYFFNNFIAKNENIFMVTCGHISAEYFQTSINNYGKAVYELLQDYQNRRDGGEGYLRLLRFYSGRIEVKTYSPYLDMFEDDDNSQFTIDIHGRL